MTASLPTKTELERVLDALYKRREQAIDEAQARSGSRHYDVGEPVRATELEVDAARLLREMARDFDEYADHGLDSRGLPCPRGMPRTETRGSVPRPCTCGLDSARARWRLQ